MSVTAAVAVQSTALSGHGIAMLIFTAIVFVIFIMDRWPITTVCLAILAIMPLGFVLFPTTIASGPLDPARFYAGFGHPAVVAICALMVVGHALVVTGALEPVARRLAGWVAASPKLALLGLILVPCLASGLVNDTPVVVLLIPLIIAAAARAHVSAGTMLLPMNYAVLIGGMATTIGTSTNLIVVALAAQLGVVSFDLFSFYPMVLTAAVPALLYLWLIAPRILARVEPPKEKLVEPVFDAELHVSEGSLLEGKQLRDLMKMSSRRLNLLMVKRKHYSLAKLPSLTLMAGDRLIVQDTAENLKDIENLFKASLHRVDDETDEPLEVTDSKAPPKSPVVAQMVVTPESPLAERTVSSSRLAERFGVVVVGIQSRKGIDGWQRVDLSNRVLGAGDVLLVQGQYEAIQDAQRSGIGLLLDAQFTLPRTDKAAISLMVIAAVVLLASTKVLPISAAAVAGALTLVFLRCLSWEDVTQALSIKVVMLVAASLAIGDALEIIGATRFLAEQLASVSRQLPASGVLVLLIGLMGLLTNFVSNNASAAIGTPLGIELASLLGVPPEPFVLAVLFGCNLCYLTPMGYQTNLLVMNAGGYRFRDFVIVGTPLFLIMWAGLSYLLIRQYGL